MSYNEFLLLLPFQYIGYINCVPLQLPYMYLSGNSFQGCFRLLFENCDTKNVSTVKSEIAPFKDHFH